ncbi:mechanosensitive ion channel family protein [Algibacter lectus]|uniref:Mechanosensitive ion channel-like protein n=1 Tax=Algibacter lectus TaxID=221126 RepID=A0A090VJE8_9FLAO|nr:mechanosensitive ion channel domain-containing protein [Algibacter lectus]MWW26771.1 mechanosensitive ion channel [Algibacter lectus]TDY65510.1 mechanosensitive ion channel-like protein [Algibacter lectus]GAL64880.1 potassium efflux system KefA protein [Algibacter lectus]SFD66189.1 Mechanosensitive ion channel [Algibacter lectus]
MQDKVIDQIEDTIENSSIWEQFMGFLNYNVYTYTIKDGSGIETGVLKVKSVLLVLIILILTTYFLRFARNIMTRKMSDDDKSKFFTVFSFARWLIYLVVLLIAMDSIGINVTAIFAASAALLIGVGLALQTLFQDIISGIFILIDQSVHVGDIIEIEGKVGRVEEIKLRTTRAVTIDNRVLIIPNHLYLANSLYNWTQNGSSTREAVEVGVAYGSDVQLVKKILLEAAANHESVMQHPEPYVFFTNFGDSALEFKLVFTINDSFQGAIPKSEIRFEIDRLFRENKISIPFPQRDIHIIKQ